MLTRDDLKIPRSWEIIAAGDTGTYMSGAIAALDTKPKIPSIYILEEFPNYQYTGDGAIELLDITVGQWMKMFATRLKFYTGESRNAAWVDENTTFKTEIAHGLRFMMNRRSLELRTEITREYLAFGSLFFMPWLTVIPYEMEMAKWPEHESFSSGSYKRIKDRDHSLDCVEHICSRRPINQRDVGGKTQSSALQKHLEKHRRMDRGMIGGRPDPHLGAQ